MFKKYNSIENSYQDECLERIKGHGLWHDDYVVQEKAHGANLSFYTLDGEHFKAAKRTDDIGEDENFFNYDAVLAKIKPKLVNIWDALKQDNSDLKQMTVFGEIIGGDYPHDDVARLKEATRVQQGIYYSPNNVFYAFDILVNTEKYLDVFEANTYFEKEGLLFAKVLFKGSLTDCLSYPNDFESTLPNDLGLPALAHNICEGVVIKPVKTTYFNNDVRVIIKNKNERWAENKKYHKSISAEDEYGEKTKKLQEAIQTYITENRLNNVISKVGEVTKKDFGKILGMFNKDIVEAFSSDYRAVIDALEKKELKYITKSIGVEANQMVKDKLVEVIG